MKKIRKNGNKKALKGILTVTCTVMLLLLPKSVCFADATGKVTAPTAKIRESADINSEVIASSSQGKTVNITAEVTDASGTIWYEVFVDSNTKGYIRSDLVEKDALSGSVPSRTAQSMAATDTTAQTQTQSAAPGAEAPAETEMEAHYATVKVPAAKIRSIASTTGGIVDTVAQNTQLIASGQTSGGDGHTWYYVTFTGTGGQEKTGFVRNDLVDLGEPVPADETENPEENMEITDESDEEFVNKDYEVVYEQTEDGGVWYLYNNLENKKQKLEDLLEIVSSQELNDSIDASTVTKQRIAIVIMIVVIFFMAVVMTIMFFKIRDAYYEAYEEEEEEEVNEKPRNNKRISEDKTQKAVSRPSSPSVKKKTAESDKKMPVKEVTYEEGPESQLKPAPKKKAKNFMMEDEEFEFEFLNRKKD